MGSLCLLAVPRGFNFVEYTYHDGEERDTQLPEIQKCKKQKQFAGSAGPAFFVAPLPSAMLSKKLFSVLSILPTLAFSAPSPVSQQILLSPGAHKSHGIPQALFDDFDDLAKIVDITNCLQTPEGITYPFQCNSFCREFPELKLLKQWNTDDDSYGYIAISHEKGKERIIIAFAGAYGLTDAVIDLSATPDDYIPLFSVADSAPDGCPGCKVHGEVYRKWLKTEDLIASTVSEFVTQYISAEENPYQLVLVGYKLGGAVATLAAVDFEARGWNPQVTTFGQPKVGNGAFVDYLTGKFTPLTYRRVTHISDPVPHFPLDRQGFAHYEYEYFVSKELAPYTAADVQICSGNADPTCAARMDISDPLSLDWENNDYFHHADTCIREPTSLFSFSSSFFIFEFENLGWSNTDPEFYATIEKNSEERDNPSPTESEEPRNIKNNQKRNVHIDSDTRLVKPIPDSKFVKAFAMVEPAPKRVPPEFEDEELYHAMRGHDKAQGMWIKPQRRPVTDMQKRDVVVDPDTKFVKAIPDSRFKKVFAMVDPPEPEPEEEVYVPEYEDEEIYNSMRGFKTAQSMWIKPKESSEKEKRNIHPELKTTDAKNRLVFDGIDSLKELHGEKEISESEKSPFKSPHGLEVPPYKDAPELDISPLDHAPVLQYDVGLRYSAMDSFRFDDLSFSLEFDDLEIDNLEIGGLEKRGLERALKFFHAPKEVLNAQLAANDEAAAYEAHLKAQKTPSGKAEIAPSGNNPNEDYVKKGGSVLIMNGRPLEVDGRPVNRNPIQKRGIGRGNGRGPGSGLSRGSSGPRLGGLKRGGGDKVTEMSSSSPPTTQSNSVVGVIENAVPRSLEEETVNVQKGRNFVLMNGRPMPANFAQKSTKPQKRSFAPDQVFGPVQHLRTPDEHFSRPEPHSRTPENRKPENFRTSKENLSHAEQGFRKPGERFGNTEQYFPVPEKRFSITGEHLREPEEHLCQPEDYFEIFYPEDKFTIPEQRFNAPEDYFYISEEQLHPGDVLYSLDESSYIPHERIYTPQGQHFTSELPQEPLDFSAEEQFEVPESCFYIPGERAYLPEKNEHIPNQREMWEIQKYLTGPITHAWKDSRTNNEVYTGELPSEAEKMKFLHNYSYNHAN